MQTLRMTLLGAPAIALLAGSVAAQDIRGFYIEGGAGANFLQDMDFEYSDVQAEISFDTGFAAGARAGYGFEGGFRAEGEVMFRRNAIDAVTGTEWVEDEDDAHVQSVAVMGNVYYDFLNSSSFTPYIGAGLGVAFLRVEVDEGYDGGGYLYEGSASDTVLAAQARAGAAYALTPNISVTADYTYFRAFDATMEIFMDYGESDFPAPDRYLGDLENHTVMAGLRYTFGQPMVAPPPVVAEPDPAPPVAQQVFLVFFDFDRSNLTAEANNTLDQVVVAHNEQQVTRIMVDGHTDRSGPASYNQGLSERRAESVRQGLIARGVAPDEIVTRAFGETQNLVPTPDGVREPQNRRVEIIFS